MGFFLLDPDDGKVVGQFPHLYPIWIAIGYGVDGLTGARYIIGLWGVLGVMAVYFAGMWLVGRPAAAVGALLLSIHVAQVWYSRYPNAELLMQVFLFAGLLAFSRASVDGDRFFAPVAAVLATLAFLAHITAICAIGALLGASVLGVFDGRRPQAAFVIPLVAGTAAAAAYYGTTLSPYVALPVGLYQHLPRAPRCVPAEERVFWHGQPRHLALMACAGGVRLVSSRPSCGWVAPYVPSSAVVRLLDSRLDGAGADRHRACAVGRVLRSPTECLTAKTLVST